MLEKAANGTYQLILMDIQMPVMNGYDAAKKIRRMEAPPKADIPIIAMTANAFSEDRQAALDAGAPLFVLDGAVIVGTAAQAECDRLCVVTAPFETSVARIVARDGISAEMAARRLNAQTPETMLTAQADYVLRNDADLAHLQAAAEELCGKLLAEGGAGKEL